MLFRAQCFTAHSGPRLIFLAMGVRHGRQDGSLVRRWGAIVGRRRVRSYERGGANQTLQATAATLCSRTFMKNFNIIIAGHDRFRRLCLS